MKSRQNKRTAAICAIFAAALYALNSPVSKLLLTKVPAVMMAAFLYLGAGIGLSLIRFVQQKYGKKQTESPLTKKELPYTVGMVMLDIAASIFQMIGLSMTSAANASLLNNFEIAATSVIAFMVFKEFISIRLWIAVGLVSLASMIISVGDTACLTLSFGSLFILLSCICWGFENNFTRMISDKDPLEIVVIKGFGCGTGSMMISLILGERLSDARYIFPALFVGFVSFGLSILFYIYAQRELGAARTSTFYALSPFIGVLLSLILFREVPSVSFVIALVIMIIGTYFAGSKE
ncbi:DMT family transporter [Novisyntrophococcus fermenticellae]|uniref:DMT family transporter n=1 Tax=Novisyntrophococcus fermenticellae TaxID=2068655 RepID=UPI001E29E229|nr:DMT family transporter [Novisyntrophococcus fermenticellae]